MSQLRAPAEVCCSIASFWVFSAVESDRFRRQTKATLFPKFRAFWHSLSANRQGKSSEVSNFKDTVLMLDKATSTERWAASDGKIKIGTSLVDPASDGRFLRKKRRGGNNCHEGKSFAVVFGLLTSRLT